jgi:hypothetical protein
MKKGNLVIVTLTLVVLALTATALTGGEDLFDVKRSQREIEIMRGILRTSLSFVGEDLEAPFSRTDWQSIDGFYLYGQGAVFVISVPAPDVAPVYSVQAPSEGALLRYMMAPEPPAPPGEPGLARGYYVESLAALEAGEAEQAEVEEYLAQLEQIQEAEREDPEIRKEIAEARARAEKRQQEIAERKRERAERLADYETQLRELEERLVETLAGHGDSLSQVAPEEYVTLVLSPSAMAFGWIGDESNLPSRVISVKKSTITAHKTGKLSADAFRRAVLLYTN